MDYPNTRLVVLPGLGRTNLPTRPYRHSSINVANLTLVRRPTAVVGQEARKKQLIPTSFVVVSLPVCQFTFAHEIVLRYGQLEHVLQSSNIILSSHCFHHSTFGNVIVISR